MHPHTPPLLKPHATLCALYARIMAEPGADEPRLQFADAAREAADDWADGPEKERRGLRDWAELIALQYALEALGPPRFAIEDDASIHHKGGPDYFECEVGIEPERLPFAVGGRVDVTVNKEYRRAWGLRPSYHGLLVRKINPGGDFGTALTLKRDELSVPYPRGRLFELENAAEVLVRGDLGLAIGCFETQRKDVNYAFTDTAVRWRWGFPSTCEVSAVRLERLGNLVDTYPIREVYCHSPPAPFVIPPENVRNRFPSVTVWHFPR